MSAVRRFAAVATLMALAGALPLVSAAGKPRRPTCQLLVNNKTPFRTLIHINGVYWGWVNPQQSFTYKGVPEGTAILYADTQYAESFWGPKTIKCKDTARWDLTF